MLDKNMLRLSDPSPWQGKSFFEFVRKNPSHDQEDRSTQSAANSLQSLDDDQLKSQSNLSRFFGVISVLTIGYGFFSGKRIFTVIGLVIFSISALALFAFRKELEKRALNASLEITRPMIAKIEAFNQAKETLYQELGKVGTVDLINKKFTFTNADRRAHLGIYNTLRTFISKNGLETGESWEQLSVSPPIAFNAALLKEVLARRTDTYQQDSAILDRYDGIVAETRNSLQTPTEDLFGRSSTALGAAKEKYISDVLSGIETFHQHLRELQTVLNKIEPT